MAKICHGGINMTAINFGHAKENGVLLLTSEDSNVKHQRNALLATTAISTIFTLGISSLWVCAEAEREVRIRDINRKFFKELPYSHCVRLEKYGETVYNDLFYSLCYKGDVVHYKKQSDPLRLTALKQAQQQAIEKRERKAAERAEKESREPYEYTVCDAHWDLSDIK